MRIPKIGDHVLFRMDRGRGYSETTWQDGLVIAVSSKLSNECYAMKVKYRLHPSLQKWWQRKPQYLCAWLADSQLVGFVGESSREAAELAELERMTR